MDKFDVIIIGSGLGGLLCGYILSKEGFHVCILEKQPVAGGNLLTFNSHGNKFETGVHYIGAMGPGQTLNRYWNYFGLTNRLNYKQLDQNGFDIIGFNNQEFPTAQGFSNFQEQLLPHFPDAGNQLSSYIKEIQKIVEQTPLYHLELPKTHQGHPFADQSALEFFKNIASGKKNSKTGVELASVLAGNNLLYGGREETPVFMAALINHSFISGAHRIVGGSDQVAKLLISDISSMGGEVLVNEEVCRIDNNHNNFIINTKTSKSYITGKVISAIHPASTLKIMHEDAWRPAFRKRVISLKNTIAPFILYLSLKPGTFPYLNHNYYIHNTKQPWISSGEKFSWPAMYMLSTAAHSGNPDHAKTATILTYMNYEDFGKWENTTTGHRSQDYLSFKEEKAQVLLNQVFQKFPGLRLAVSNMEISTPLTYRDYTGTPEGSMYGIQKSYRQPVETTLHPRTKLPGFYFTGQNTNLQGVLGVTIGSVLTCGEIIGTDYLLKKIRNA
jgi:all-trans-retinol 13,14-reductase